MQLTAILQSISRAESHPSQKLKRVMRLTAILLLTACLHVAAKTNGQTVTLNVKDAPMKSIFREIQKQTGLNVIMEESALEKLKSVTLDVHNMPVSDVLAICLKGEALSYLIIDRRIVVKSTTTPEFQTADISAPLNAIDITGRVTDTLGIPLVGATISVKGNFLATQTNNNGEFILKGVQNNATIIVSYTGYESQTIKLNGRNNIVLQLIQAYSSLLDVVVNKGYYTTTQKLNTGDVSTVGAKVIEQQPVTNVLAALEGRVPGLVITQTTGAPNGAFRVQIRGQNSLSNGNDPYYIVDGVPYLSQFVPNTNLNKIGQQGNPLNFINPSDIESVEVLKDADATAIYGSRGANGVILITTKKGKEGSMKVDVNMYAGVGNVSRKVDLMNTPQYLQMRREAFVNDHVTPTVANAPDLKLWDTTRYTDWQKTLIGGTANYTDIQGSVSGGTRAVQYLIGGGYHRETTVYPGDNADQKASLHFSVNSTSANQKFKVKLTGSFLVDNSDLLANEFASTAYRLPPDAPALYNPDGSLNWEPTAPGLAGTWVNPMSALQQKYKAKTSNFVGNAVISYSIFRNLDFKTSVGYTSTNIDEISTTPLSSYDPGYHLTSGSSGFANSAISTSIVEPQFNYKTNVSKGVLSVILGGTYQQNDYTGSRINATGFSSDALLQDPQAASNITYLYSTGTQYKYIAAFGQLNFNWEDKYIINVTARRDGSSRFGPDKQFANFGAIGAAWIFSDENFVKNNLQFLSFGKIRASYGTTGNDQIADYGYLSLYNVLYGNAYSNTQGIFPANLFNPDLAWELTKKLEIGMDLGFLNDRLLIGASWFYNRSSNQLMNYRLSDVTGFPNIVENLPATIQNSGLEFSIRGTIIKNQNFTWSSSINLSTQYNKLVSFPGLGYSSYSNTYIVGQPYSIAQFYQVNGVDPQTGRFQFVDSKGDLTYTPDALTDRTVVQDIRKNYYYGGFQNTFRYKGFELDFIFQFVHQLGYPFQYLTPMPGFKSVNQPVDVLDRWQKEGDNALFPKFTQSTANPVYQAYRDYYANSDRVLADASFIRLKNLSLSYTLPAQWLSKMKIQNLRFYIQGQNLLTITSYQGADPENQANNAIPPLRVLTGGFQITF